uniref:Uncharacterized protein n=1 Tax=Romanomermis culicivorax TaxID=13658 RepID=A0A915K5R8_ROMCU
MVKCDDELCLVGVPGQGGVDVSGLSVKHHFSRFKLNHSPVIMIPVIQNLQGVSLIFPEQNFDGVSIQRPIGYVQGHQVAGQIGHVRLEFGERLLTFLADVRF